MTVGLIIMVIGLASLGRSFGIMPRARGLVQSGLYRWVRHPIYLGEFLAFGWHPDARRSARYSLTSTASSWCSRSTGW